MQPNPAGGSGASGGRDGWCTPEWLADLLGVVDLDPCCNVRSHVEALWRCIPAWGGDGLDPTDSRPGAFWRAHSPGSYCNDVMTGLADADWTVFINPPYSHGEVIRWVRHYRHTRFRYLLRWDPSTQWFAELFPHATHVWFPGRRINFEPPPGVKASSNPFPHALYIRHPDGGLLGRLHGEGYLIPVDNALPPMQGDPHVQHPLTCTSNRGAGGPARSKEGGAGDGAGARRPEACSCIEGSACPHPAERALHR